MTESMRKLSTKALIRVVAILLLMAFAACFSMPLKVHADEAKKVRVGWHEQPHFIKDQYGRKSGYSYEYLRKIAAYTGWEYEYVEGTWSDLMEMLKKGEIDILSDVSYTEEREKSILYPTIPMGTESYYLYVSADNKEISSKNLSTMNGKRIGVTQGTVQKDFLADWIKSHGITAEIIEMNSNEDEAIKLLGSNYDAYVTMDTHDSSADVVPVCKIGSSEFYFAVNKNRYDLLSELDTALNKIREENSHYDHQLHDKYLKSNNTNKYLSTGEKDWLKNHGRIRVGYQDNYLAFCAKDPSTGKLIGALKDYLDYAASTFADIDLEFEAISYPTAAAAMEALKNGEIDCVFPANLTDNDSEEMRLVMTPALMRTEMDAVVRSSEQKEFIRKEKIVVAVNEGNTNYDMFLADNYPNWQRKYFKDTPAGLQAIANGQADCVIISNYRYNNISKQCEKLGLSTVYTGVDMDYYFAVRQGDTELYSILVRVINAVPDSVVNTSLTYYSTEDAKLTPGEFIRENIIIILIVLIIILLIISILLLNSIRANKKVIEKEHQVKALNRKAFVDSLTSVRNKGAYTEYMQKLQERLDNDGIFALAIGIFDCNNLKTVNDRYGHDKGDIYLRNSCQIICKVFDHSPVFRLGGDEFAVFLMNDDFTNRAELVNLFEQRKNEINSKASEDWEKIDIAYGIVDYDPETDKTLEDTVRRADQAMYEHKRLVKAKKSL